MAHPSAASTSPRTPVIKRSLSDIGSEEDILTNVPSSCKRFASKVIDVYIGDERYHYAAHTAFLFKSSELKAQYEVADKAKKKTSKTPTVLNLPRESPKEFGQLLEYLYLGQLTLVASEPQSQADELLSIWVMGSKHYLIDMQKQVIRKLEQLDMAGKLPALAFLHLADNMYESEVDNGLRRYFAKVAPGVVRKIKTTDLPTLLNIMSEGGSFASDLFNAYTQASGQGSGEADHSKSGEAVKYEGEQQRDGHAKRARVDDASSFIVPTSASSDVRTKWDEEHNIPEAWETASTEDKLLMTKAEDGLPWLTIADLWEKATGTRMSIVDLMQRCDRIKVNILRLGQRDADLLQAARTSVEGKFNHEKWPLIAAHIAKNGGSKYEPIRLKRYCDAIDAAARKEKMAENAFMLNSNSNRHHGNDTSNGVLGSHSHMRDLRSNNGAMVNYTGGKQNSEPPIEVVGGVRVENSKPLNPRRRRRVAIKAPTARQAKTPSAPATRAGANKNKRPATLSTSINVISSDSDDSDTPMRGGGDGDGGVSREGTTVYVDADEEPYFGPADTGVRVSNEGRSKGPGGMRVDNLDGEIPVAGRAKGAIEGVGAGGYRVEDVGTGGTVVGEVNGEDGETGMVAEDVD